ncbi:MAG: hypothetical protein HY021_06090 [Burkholderiales bacterium]|nr:hypothetical protein [Burkholderiales bacterium]
MLVSGLLSGLAFIQAAAWAQAPAAASAPASAASAPSIRIEAAKALNAAQDAIRANNSAEALAKLREVEALPNPSPYETYLTQRLKAVASIGAGDNAGAVALFEQVMGSSQLPAADRLPIAETVAKLAVQLKDYPRAVRWLRSYRELGGRDAALLRLLPQVLTETGDFAGAATELMAEVQADDAAGRVTDEAQLRRLAFSQNKLNDSAAYVATLERLTAAYPKLDYWSELIARAVRREGFGYERLALDVYRLRRAVGLALEADELADFAARAQQAGLPGEAQKLLEEGYALGQLGKGADAAAQNRLRDQVTKSVAQDKATFADTEKGALAGKDGNSLVNLALAVSGAGDHAKATTLMAQGIAKGGLRRADEAQLHLGLVQWRAGRNDEALRSFEQLKTSADGTSYLAKLWAMHLRSLGPAKKQ